MAHLEIPPEMACCYEQLEFDFTVEGPTPPSVVREGPGSTDPGEGPSASVVAVLRL